MKKTIIVLLFLMFVFLCVFPCGCKKNQHEVRGAYKLYVEYEKGIANVLFLYTVGSADVDKNEIFFSLAANAEYLSKFNVCAFNFLSVKVNNAFTEYRICGENKEFLTVSKEKSFLCGDNIQIEYELELQNDTGGLGINGKTVDFFMFYPLKCIIKNGAYLLLPQNKNTKFTSCDYADYFLSLTVKSTYVVACGLNVLSCEVQGEKTTYKYQTENSLNIEFLLSEKYAVEFNKSCYKSINYYYCKDEQVNNTISKVNKVMAFFGEITAEYPNNGICVAQTTFYSDFVENPHIILLPDCVGCNSVDYNKKVVYAAARMQIYSLIAVDKYTCGYFYEGLCEYLVYKYYEKYAPSVAEQIKECAEKTCIVYQKNCKRLNLPYKNKLKYPLNCFLSTFEYSCVCKCGGLLFFLNLEKNVSEKVFLQGLKVFFSKFYLQRVSEQDFIKVFLAYKNDVNALFEKYVFS